MNNIDKALTQICGSDDLRDWMNKPFKMGDSIYATDASIIAKVSEKIVSGKYSGVDDKYIQLILPLFDFEPKNLLTISIKEISEVISKVELVDEYLDTDTEGSCNECNGEGEVEWEYDIYTRDMDCPVCDGNGTITEEKRTKTGNKVLHVDLYIDIKVCRFSIAMISQLVLFAETVGVEEIEVINQTFPNRVTVFKVGEVELGLMPVTISGDMKVIHSF